MKARSRQGGVSFSLVSGPAELSVTPNGKILWPVPKALEGEDMTALIRIRDGSGQSGRISFASAFNELH